MPARRYTIVWVDCHGRPIRRLRVARGSIISSVVAASLGLAMAVWGTLRLFAAAPPPARHAPAPSLATLSARVGALEARWQPVADQAARNQAAFAQVWARSASASATVPALYEPGFDAEAVATRHGDEVPLEGSSWVRPGELDDLALLSESERRLGAVERRGAALYASLMETIDHFHDAAQQVASTPSIRPSLSPWLSSSYGRRLDPITQRWVMHKGLDLAGSIGMPIFAPADDKVIWTGWRGGYGKTVVIDHGYGLQTHFAHLDAYQVDAGQRVHRGDTIARMGNSGRSTGPHLHYEVRRNGQPLDPRDFILD